MLSSTSNMLPNSPLSVNEAFSEATHFLYTEPHREQTVTDRDPRKRAGVTTGQVLPTPSFSAVKRIKPSWNSFHKGVGKQSTVCLLLNSHC